MPFAKTVTSSHHSFKPDSNVTNHVPYPAFTPCKQTLTHTPLPLIHSHCHLFALCFHTSTHACKRTTHTRAWVRTHTGNPSFQFPTTVQWSTTLHSTSHNLDKHIYSWFLCREGPTVNAGWQDRHISLSGRILHAFVRLYNMYCGSSHNRTAVEDTQLLYEMMHRCHWEPVSGHCDVFM